MYGHDWDLPLGRWQIIQSRCESECLHFTLAPCLFQCILIQQDPQKQEVEVWSYSRCLILETSQGLALQRDLWWSQLLCGTAFLRSPRCVEPHRGAHSGFSLSLHPAVAKASVLRSWFFVRLWFFGFSNHVIFIQNSMHDKTIQFMLATFGDLKQQSLTLRIWWLIVNK